MKSKRRYRFRNEYKGIKEYNHIVNYFLRLDNVNGKSYNKLAIEYSLTRDCIAKRIKNWNENYYE